MRTPPIFFSLHLHNFVTNSATNFIRQYQKFLRTLLQILPEIFTNFYSIFFFSKNSLEVFARSCSTILFKNLQKFDPKNLPGVTPFKTPGFLQKFLRIILDIHMISFKFTQGFPRQFLCKFLQRILNKFLKDCSRNFCERSITKELSTSLFQGFQIFFEDFPKIPAILHRYLQEFRQKFLEELC